MKRCPVAVIMTSVLLGAYFGNAPLAEGPVEAISIGQYFDDGKDRSGTIVYVNGPVVELTFEEDPFSETKEISTLMMRKGEREILVLFETNLPPDIMTVGTNATIKFKAGAIFNNYEMVWGELILGNVDVFEWSSSEKPALSDFISVEDYFANNLRYGDKRVTLEGTVYTFGKAGDGSIFLDFNTDGGDVNIFISSRYWDNEETRVILKSLKEGDRIEVKGSFDMEGTMTIFAGETLAVK